MHRPCSEPGCDRPAVFKYRGEIRADRDHDLCQYHYRRIRESNRQKEIAMSDKEVTHLHGVPLTMEPQSVKELHQVVLKMKKELLDQIQDLRDQLKSKK